MAFSLCTILQVALVKKMMPQKSKYLSDQKPADKARSSLWCLVHHTEYSSSVLTESSKTNSTENVKNRRFFLRAVFITRESKFTRDSSLSDMVSWFYHVLTKFLLTCKLTKNWKRAFLSNSGTPPLQDLFEENICFRWGFLKHYIIPA